MLSNNNGKEQDEYTKAKAGRKKRFILIPIIAAAAFLVAAYALNITGAPFGRGVNVEDGPYTPEAFAGYTPGRDIPFDPVEAGFTTNDPNIKMIEINQSLSYGFDTDTGRLYLMENFVAGKETAVFVKLGTPPAADSEMILTIEKDRRFVASLAPAAIVDDTTILFLPEDIAGVNDWEQGAYTITFDMDESRAVRTTNFFESMEMKVLAVPVLANYSGRVVSCLGDWRYGSTMIEAAYPVAKKGVDYVLHPELDLSDGRYDLNTDIGQFNVWEALKNLQTPDKDYTMIVGYIRYPANHGQYLGYTYGQPANVVCESEPDLYATVVHEIAHCYLIGDEYEGGGLNNELNSPPYRMQGHDIVTREPAEGIKEAVVSGFSVGINGSGSMVYPEQRPFWVEGRTLLGAVTSYMGSGTGEDSFKFWTTSDIWNHLFNVFTGQAPMVILGDESGEEPGDSGPAEEDGDDEDDYWGQCPNCYGDVYDPPMFVQCRNCYEFTLITGEVFPCRECGNTIVVEEYTKEEAAIGCFTCESLIWLTSFVDFNGGSFNKGITARAAEPELVTVTEITGVLEADGTFSPDPWYSYPAHASVLSANKIGDYAVYIYDENGEKISATYFDALPTAEINTAEGRSFLESAGIPVEVVVRLPEDAAKFVILKGEEEIYERAVSESAPEVAITDIEPYENIGDEYTLNWEASDEDGDELYFDVYYYYNDTSYYLMAANVTDSSLDLDLTGYPGADEGYFRIRATDGVHTSESLSEFVTVPFKAPEIFTDNAEVPQYAVTQEFRYEIDAYDKQDGWLQDEEIEWILNDEHYAYGAALTVRPYELEPGIHTFTVTAANSAGLSDSKDFSVEILDDESDLPDDWSKDIIKYALKSGCYASQARPEAPVTRADFAQMMTAMYGVVSGPEGAYPDVEEDLISDCTGNLYDAGLMVFLGVMEAEDGIFEPQKSMTESEAAIVMYKVARLAAGRAQAGAEAGDEEEGDEEIIEKLIELGVFGGDDENELEEDGKLSYKLSLVRCGLFLKTVYGE